MVNFNSILSYKTVKIVDIHDWRLGALHYAIILGIFCYVVVWVIILEKGYQAQGPLIGNANLKVKGNAMVGGSVWDVYDVGTNLISKKFQIHRFFFNFSFFFFLSLSSKRRKCSLFDH